MLPPLSNATEDERRLELTPIQRYRSTRSSNRPTIVRVVESPLAGHRLQATNQ